MEVKNEKVVSLTYQLRVNGKEGEIVETVTEENPLTFIYGVGNLLPKFEENLHGLKEGDDFDFMLTSEDAYGTLNDKAVVDVPLSAFMVDDKVDTEMLYLGNTIPMRDQDGNRLNGIVKNIGDEVVTMDFNHPLAGDDLFFTGKVSGIREATLDELEHGHVHSPGSCEGCNDENCHSKHDHDH